MPVMERVGKDGVITVEEAQTVGLSYDVVEGMQFDKGYISPYMITDAKSRKAEMKDPAILLTDKKISSVEEILPILEKLAQGGKKELVIIAEDVDGQALATLIVNKLRGAMITQRSLMALAQSGLLISVLRRLIVWHQKSHRAMRRRSCRNVLQSSPVVLL